MKSKRVRALIGAVLHANGWVDSPELIDKIILYLNKVGYNNIQADAFKYVSYLDNDIDLNEDYVL